jgi:hypothetical protein
MKLRAFATLLLTVIVAVPAVQATTYIVPEDRELVRMADAIVIARAGTPVSEPHPLFGIATRTPLVIEEVLKGDVSGVVEIVEPGGALNGRYLVVTDSATYTEGERALVFLGRFQGNWHTREMMLGKFNFVRDSRGRELLVRGGGMHDPPGFTPQMEPHREMRRAVAGFSAYIRAIAAGEDPVPDYFVPMDARLEVESHREIEGLATATAFLMQFESKGIRWTVFDTGGSTTYATSGTQSGTDSLGATDRALSAWSDDPNSTVQSSRIGTATDDEPVFSDNRNVVIFNYPSDGAAWNGNTSAIGLGIVGFGATHVRNGETFMTCTDGDVVIKAGLTLNQTQFDELMTHELGHTLGFRHSDQGTPSSSSAIMRSSLVGTFGANLQGWDTEAVSTVYGAGPVCTNPAITTQPQSVSINQGAQTTLSVVATGTAPTYRWYQGIVPSTSVPLGTSSTQTVSPSSTTNYWVRVTACSTSVDSSTATVTVTCNAPSISGQPQSVSIQEGQQTTLSVSASAGSTFQWFIGSAPGSGTPISGATSSSLTVSPATDTGYWVRVTACIQSVNSDVATVTVTCGPPQITQPPQNRTINPGGVATLSVGATGSAPLSYQWYQGTFPSTSTPLGTTSSINVSPTTATSYWVRVTNACGTDDSNTVTVNVSVCDPPTITGQPESKTALANQQFSITVLHVGTFPFSYQWYRGATGTVTSPVSGGTSQTLTTSVSTTTSFWARITNCAGEADSEAATITVTSSCVPPSITTQPAGSTIFSGQSATLTVVAAGTNPAYQWFKGTAPGGTSISGATSASLTVTPAVTTSYWVRVTACSQTANSQTATVTVSTCPAGKLCTHQKRFELSLTARDQRSGNTAPGVPLQENDLFGFFTLPALTGSTENPEVFVKVIDASGIGSGFWVFYGGLTDLEFTLTVDDKQTGARKTYKKEPGSYCGGADTGAFAAGVDFGPSVLEEPLGTDDTVRTFACGAKSLCLLDGRFDVTLAARDQRTGNTGTGVPLPKNKLFGYFALPELTGSTQNPEVFVKMLDASGIGSGFWVFYGGLTDLEYTLTVKDQVTGAVKTYTKAPGSYCGGADTGAFPAKM